MMKSFTLIAKTICLSIFLVACSDPDPYDCKNFEAKTITKEQSKEEQMSNLEYNTYMMGKCYD